jgi:transcriptional regulator with XRE-family HTH domain
MTFGQLLKKLKDQRQLSESELSDRSSVKRATIHQYIIGLRQPTLENAIKLALGLGVSLDTFAACEFPHRAVSKK